ncbi:MAG TPA: GNAT family N-acyltransferase [Candidatus Aquilonibacter sp.]|nr:GNAT family N-acyltransferase [Candidatus Aquilonibacter sp.]
MPIDHSQRGQAQDGVLSRISAFPGLAGKFAPVERVRDLYRRVRQSPHGFRLENLLAEMQIEVCIDPADAARIPVKGPVVVVANHPFGVLDGAILTVLLTRARSDVKVMTNALLGDIPELDRHCIFVDPFQTDRSIDVNRRALKEALAWLREGGMLAIFPSGEVSHWQLPHAQIADAAWNDTAVRLIRRTGASALPVYFCGRNSVGFQLLGMIHPRLRTAFLLQEFLQQEGKTVEVRVGSEIANDSIASFAGGRDGDREAIEYLRSRTYLLGQRNQPESAWPAVVRSVKLLRPQEAIVDPVPRQQLGEEIAGLAEDRLLARNGDLRVYLAKGDETPQLLNEVGRLREVTFRAAGEGTGKRIDLDRFDQYYWHLLLWHAQKQELVGAYRVGNTAEIIAAHGISGLYTSTCFRYDPELFQRLGPAFELGRSFVRSEYQREYAPLLLLWKGIAQLAAAHPECPVLFGAVSISNTYSRVSREIIYRFFEARRQNDELAGLVEPRQPFRASLLRRWDCRAMCQALRDLDDLSQPIEDVESDGKGLPVLLRQYHKIGGKLLGFNVDRKFSNVLDGLVLVDLRQTDPAVLERYMGREAAARFRQQHGL